MRGFPTVLPVSSGALKWPFGTDSSCAFWHQCSKRQLLAVVAVASLIERERERGGARERAGGRADKTPPPSRPTSRGPMFPIVSYRGEQRDEREDHSVCVCVCVRACARAFWVRVCETDRARAVGLPLFSGMREFKFFPLLRGAILWMRKGGGQPVDIRDVPGAQNIDIYIYISPSVKNGSLKKMQRHAVCWSFCSIRPFLSFTSVASKGHFIFAWDLSWGSIFHTVEKVGSEYWKKNIPEPPTF